MAAVGMGHVGSVGADAGELWAVQELGRFLGQLDEAGGCGQDVGEDCLGSTVMGLCGEGRKVLEMSAEGRAVGGEELCSEGRIKGVIQVFRTRGVALALGLEG